MNVYFSRFHFEVDEILTLTVNVYIPRFYFETFNHNFLSNGLVVSDIKMLITLRYSGQNNMRAIVHVTS